MIDNSIAQIGEILALLRCQKICDWNGAYGGTLSLVSFQCSMYESLSFFSFCMLDADITFISYKLGEQKQPQNGLDD